MPTGPRDDRVDHATRPRSRAIHRPGGETLSGPSASGVEVRSSSFWKAPWGQSTSMKDWERQAPVKSRCEYHITILPNPGSRYYALLFAISSDPVTEKDW